MIRQAFIAAILLASLSAAHAEELTLGNWNIQTLVHAGDSKTVFPDDYQRQPADFDDLRKWRDLIAADVVFLQEVTSPAAIDEVFPVADGWTHCISGQYAALEQLTPEAPVCTKPGETPSKPAAAERQQFTGVAVRPGSDLTLEAVEDMKALNVQSVDFDGTVRNLRWGLDVTIAQGDKKLRALVVHMKSGCFDDRVFRDDYIADPTGKPPVKSSCVTLSRQLFSLHAWIAARESAGDAWLVVGDFNRRFDLGGGPTQDEVWEAITAFDPDFEGIDQDNRPDLLLGRTPYKELSLCWSEKRNPMPTSLVEQDEYFLVPIEFFVFGAKTAALIVPGSEKQVIWPNAQADDNRRLSDHCPKTLSLSF